MTQIINVRKVIKIDSYEVFYLCFIFNISLLNITFH
jgi:hypothetical protein